MAGSILFKLICLFFIIQWKGFCYINQSCCAHPPAILPQHAEFVQHSTVFWTYDKISESWRLVDFSKILNANATSKIQETGKEKETTYVHPQKQTTFVSNDLMLEPNSKRVSILRFSDTSLWFTGHSGAIYERFWNGMQWVVIPHDLPPSAGCAIDLYSVNHTILALSEAGILYQLLIDGLQWMSCDLGLNENNVKLQKSGVLSTDNRSIYFVTSDGRLFRLISLLPVRWINCGHPRGGDVANLVDTGNLKHNMVFCLSTIGDLYEYDPSGKPAWKRHVRDGSPIEKSHLAPVSGVALRDLAGTGSTSIFLITKDGLLVERRNVQSKWHWIIHKLSGTYRFGMSYGLFMHEENSAVANASLFFTSLSGYVYQYKLPDLRGKISTKHGHIQPGFLLEHQSPEDSEVLYNVPGVALSHSRLFFALRDGRIGELHLQGQGGASIGTLRPQSSRKQAGHYVWTVLDAPESEGGNAEYCTSTHGPSSCLEGVKEEPGWASSKSILVGSSTLLKQRHRLQKDVPAQTFYMDEEYCSSPLSCMWNYSSGTLFHIRTLQFGKSMFLIGQDGIVTERFFNGEMWLWLKHEFSASMSGILGVYNGSVFMVDTEGYLYIREWHESALWWLNCSAMEGGGKVVSGAPWDGLLGEARTITLEDAQLFVGENGHLMEFIVALRNFSWHDCGHPPDVHVSAILDQEVLRYRVVFIVGSDRRLYSFNRVTRMWRAHYQPYDVLLSSLPGATIRPDYHSSTVGSLYIRSESGNLLELHFNLAHGWSWLNHGLPESEVGVATAPGPCFQGNRIFVIGTNGKVYSRHFHESKWKWKCHGYPLSNIPSHDASIFLVEDKPKKLDLDLFLSFRGVCNSMVAAVRPVAFTKGSVIFVLKDGRLANLKQADDDNWKWDSIMDTPTCSCHSSYWISQIVKQKEE